MADTYITYAKRELRTFSELPFNEIDGAVFSWLCYLLIHEETSNTYSSAGMEISELMRAEYYDEMLSGVYWQDETLQLLFAVLSNPRYRGARIRYYRNESNPDLSLQFSAMVFSFSDEKHFVAFRGTDKTVHGWKEDMLLLMDKAVPCRMMAVDYLEGVAKRLSGELIVGGHSKGGNLAVYAAAHASPEIQNRISAVYSNDGPGFLKEELSHEGFSRIRAKISKIIPAGSPVGLILFNETDPLYVASSEIGPLKHYPGSWEICGTAFKRTEKPKSFSAGMADNIDRWIMKASDDEIRLFSEMMFGLVDEAGLGDDLSAILSSPAKSLKSLVRAFSEAKPEKRKYMFNVFREALFGRKANEPYEWEKLESDLNECEIGEFREKYNLFL